MFSKVIGQTAAKEQLLHMVEEDRIPHAILFCGPQGCGKLALALAFARYLLCRAPQDGDACGTCSPCRLFQNYSHPDLHFTFPIIKPKNKSTDSISSDYYMAEWQQLLKATWYFDLSDWLVRMKAENQQAVIYTRESDRIQQKLSLKSSMGGRKVSFIWLPERLNTECANKLLKLIEEPPAGTVFLLVSDQPDKILPTIQSRTQRITLKGIDTPTLEQAIAATHPECDATAIARRAAGSYTKALQLLRSDGDSELYLNLFISLMRLSYQRKIKEMQAWSDQVAALGRERQRQFLTYCQQLVRENFMYNFHRPELNYMSEKEEAFARNFARFVNERNVIKLMNELALADRDIAQNGNARIVFFDFALKIIVLLKQ